MRSSIRLVMGAITSFLAIIVTRYMAYIRLNIPLNDVSALILVAVIPGIIGGTFMVSSVAAAAGSTIGVLCWLLLFYTPIKGEIAYVTNILALEPTIGYMVLLSITFIVAGLIGHGVSIYTERQTLKEKVETKQAEEKAEEVIPVTKEKIEETARMESPAKPSPTSISVETPQIEEEIYTICKYCSEPVPEGAIFCPHCGKKVK